MTDFDDWWRSVGAEKWDKAVDRDILKAIEMAFNEGARKQAQATTTRLVHSEYDLA